MVGNQSVSIKSMTRSTAWNGWFQNNQTGDANTPQVLGV